jgi:hypothetical protein
MSSFSQSSAGSFPMTPPYFQASSAPPALYTDDEDQMNRVQIAKIMHSTAKINCTMELLKAVTLRTI